MQPNLFSNSRQLCSVHFLSDRLEPSSRDPIQACNQFRSLYWLHSDLHEALHHLCLADETRTIYDLQTGLPNRKLHGSGYHDYQRLCNRRVQYLPDSVEYMPDSVQHMPDLPNNSSSDTAIWLS